MTSLFGQLVIGPPGSGKTTYCDAMCKLLTDLGRKVAVINIGNKHYDLKNPPELPLIY